MASLYGAEILFTLSTRGFACTNSVSIELCDNLEKDPSKEQIKAVKELIGYIRKKCPNAKKVVRHFDVTGKHCPARMMTDKKWKSFLKKIGE